MLVAILALAPGCKSSADSGKQPAATTAPAAGEAADPGVARPAADPAKKPAAGAAPVRESKRKVDPKAYAKALKQGRRLIDAGKAAEAATAFRAAEAARPGDPVALSELSWAAFEAGDLAGARKAAESSVRNAGSNPGLVGASLYNLGRIDEQEGNEDAAIADYQRSYRLRPHRVVAKRLRALGAEVPTSEWRATPLKGPYKSVREFCEAIGIPNPDWLQETYCSWKGDNPNQAHVPYQSSLAPAGFDSIEWLNGADVHQDLPAVGLVFGRDDGLWVLPRLVNRGNHHDWNIDSFTDEHGRLVIQTSFEEGRYAMEKGKTITVCGVGASAKPSCYSVDLFSSYEGDEADPDDNSFSILLNCAATLTSGGRLLITAKDKTCQASGLQGEHTLVFP